MPSYADRDLVDVTADTPASLLAKSEPWHESDPSDCDRELAPADTAEQIDLADLRSIPRDALLILLRYIVQPGAAKHRWRQAQIRLALLAHMVDLDGIGELSFAALAEELGCTRALLSLRSLVLIDGLKIEKTRNGKRRSTRETYKASATEAHRRAQERRQAASGNLTHITTTASF